MVRRRDRYARRRLMVLIIAAGGAVFLWALQIMEPAPVAISPDLQQSLFNNQTPRDALEDLEVKGRAPKTGYSRSQFGDGWGEINHCSTREVILARDLTNPVIDEQCRVKSGELHDPYTGTTIQFVRGAKTSGAVQIDHVVALSDAWQKGAQDISPGRSACNLRMIH